MKLITQIMLAFVIALSAVSVAQAKEQSPSELRAEAAKLYTQADELTEKALKLEAEQASEVKSRGNEVNLRGYGAHQCVMDCIPHGSLYSCRRACGAY
ncbi:MAG: hypothetical protein ACPH3N_08325 [Alcanivorax sediminis]|uniref:hypothetical protein n=1 Tax=Alcanivorax sediminis TaxID=2663008 RepID=UPI003C668C0F